jgi:hypothetical protein
MELQRLGHLVDGPRAVGQGIGEAGPRRGVQRLRDLEAGQHLDHLDRGCGCAFHGLPPDRSAENDC